MKKARKKEGPKKPVVVTLEVCNELLQINNQIGALQQQAQKIVAIAKNLLRVPEDWILDMDIQAFRPRTEKEKPKPEAT